MVNIPATLVGVLLLSFYSNFRGKDLEKDPDFIERMNDPEFKAEVEKSFNTTLNEVIPTKSKVAVLMFFTVLLLIVLTAVFPQVRMVGDTAVSMSMVIQMLMLAFGAVILIGTKTPVNHVADTVVFKSGMTACIANRVGRCFHHPSHNTVRADPHTAFPKQKRYTSSIRRISPPLQGHTTLI